MSDVTKALIVEFFNRLGAGDLTVVDQVVSDDFVEHEHVPGLEPTKAGLRQLFGMFHAGFDKASIEVDDILVEGDKAAVRARLTGIHEGDFMGIPATGHSIDVGVCDYFRIENGQIIEHWGLMDTATMMQQLS